jgi:hypothetical protein
MTRCAEPVFPIEELAELSNRQREKSESGRLWRIREKNYWPPETRISLLATNLNFS